MFRSIIVHMIRAISNVRTWPNKNFPVQIRW